MYWPLYDTCTVMSIILMYRGFCQEEIADFFSACHIFYIYIIKYT